MVISEAAKSTAPVLLEESDIPEASTHVLQEGNQYSWKMVLFCFGLPDCGNSTAYEAAC